MVWRPIRNIGSGALNGKMLLVKIENDMLILGQSLVLPHRFRLAWARNGEKTFSKLIFNNPRSSILPLSALDARYLACRVYRLIFY